MKLLQEVIKDPLVPIVEETDGKKTLRLEGIFLQADIKNKNNRIYNSQVLSNEVARYTKEAINEGRAVGECGHPQGPQVNLDRVSHKITSLQRDGSNFVGKASVLETPMGNVIRGLIEGGVKLGVSSRGLGSLKPKDGIMEVQDDFKLVAIDAVSDPSAPNAWVDGVMENVEYFYGPDGSIQALAAEACKKTIKKMKTKKQLEESRLRLFRFYLRQATQ